MAKTIDFNRVDIEWVEFRPDANTGEARLRAFGHITNDNGDRLPRDINGWDGVPENVQAAVRTVLRQLMAVRAAHELDVAPQDIESTLDIGPNYLKFKEDE